MCSHPRAVSRLLCLGLALAASSALAATGSIRASPRHLVLAPGSAGTTTLTWSTSGASDAQVYLWTPGGTEKLFAAGPSGSQQAAWLQPGKTYVFRLYEGTSRAALLAWTSVTSQTPPASQFGFNYWPEGFGCTALDAANWSTLRPVVARDLDHIASMGGRVLRIMFWPQLSGYELRPKPEGGAFTSRFTEQTANVRDFLQLARERGLKVIVAFGNNYFDAGQEGMPGHRWWMSSYDDFAAFLGDTNTWVNGFVDSIEASPERDTVLYYDYENEYHRGHPYAGWYLTYLYDWSHVPQGKRGGSVLHIPEDSDDLHYQLGVGTPREGAPRRLDYVDFHSYPAYPHVPDIEQAYDSVRARFPDSTVLMGEFGRPAASATEEGAQQGTVLDLVNRAIAKGIPYYMNWMLWDRSPGSDPSGTALGYGMHRPKDALGGVAARLGLVANGDFEVTAGGTCWGCARPTGWMGGGTAGFTFFAGGPQASDAATNTWYGRIQTLAHPSSVWISSDMQPVRGGQRVFVNGYLRAAMRSVRMSVIEYDASRVRIRDNPGPVLVPSGWAFVNYLQAAGSSWSVQLLPETRFILVSIGGESRDASSILDVDTVSVTAH